MTKEALQEMLHQAGDNVEFVLKTPIHNTSRLFTKNDGAYIKMMNEFLIVVPAEPERFEMRFHSEIYVPFSEIAYLVDAAFKPAYEAAI